jgi:prepilin-type N-terminal cleavage/methylation domain-containing protein
MNVQRQQLNAQHPTSNVQLRKKRSGGVLEINRSKLEVGRSKFDVPPFASAFTLVEIVIGMTIIGILVAAAVPTLTGIDSERKAREPVSELARMVRTVRARAMAEQQPYQIAFDGAGFDAARYYDPYGSAEEFDQLDQQIDLLEKQKEIIEASKKRGVDPNEGVEPTAQDRADEAVGEGMRFHETFELPDGVRYSLLFWGETDWLDMEGEEFERWVFQPSGMCQPMKIRVESDKSFFEVDFHPLTGDIRSEKSWVEE